ncbi:uncharacterized protein LOC113235336 [Hyposmocoma kahamanoa]|uniref:uncharacterized protein LOC113235336 n=1 Tax=Hyposmocoma kahamanoa TaxID=1477025 RepID=UPI000E6D90B9|nr:uncharacterized protein LOC113235336 [Hyposmocoma kahamanoa]
MAKDVIPNKSQSKQGDRLSCTYAGIYFDDDDVNVDSKKANTNEKPIVEILRQLDDLFPDLWHSPSDILEEFIELEPPYTSKIVKGKTHEGILEIGKDVLTKERTKFDSFVDSLKEEEDAAWTHIKNYEKEVIEQRIKDNYDKIFLEKNRTMQNEISSYFEQSLQELEAHLKDEVEMVSIKINAVITTDLNKQIQKRLIEHKSYVNNILQQKYKIEVNKLKTYYKLLLHNEQCKSNIAINKALHDRNDALNALHKEMESNKITSTMYVMCIERKKCKVKQVLLENYHNKQITQTLRKLRKKQELLEPYLEQSMSELNLKWQEKLKKIMKLFLKFISFCLKLLPEQSTFLLDLEKIVILQLNEIQKNPLKTSSVLIDRAEVNNTFKFVKCEKNVNVCKGDPFVIETGHLPEINKHGSQDTLSTNTDLLYVRVQRQFIYAKCQKIEEVRKLLDSQRWTCKEGVICSPKSAALTNSSPDSSLSSTAPSSTMMTSPPIHYLDTDLSSNEFGFYSEDLKISKSANESLSSHEDHETFIIQNNSSNEQCGKTPSNETYVIDNFQRLEDCPGKSCKKLNWNLFFPNDFDEDSYRKINAIHGEKFSYKSKSPPKSISSNIIADPLPFSAATSHSNVGAQYSIEDLTSDSSPVQKQCFCSCGHSPIYSETDINKLLNKRRMSIIRLIQEHPNLLNILPVEP